MSVRGPNPINLWNCVLAQPSSLAFAGYSGSGDTAKNSYYIDTEKLTFQVGGKGGKTALQLQVEDAKLQVMWQDPEWQSWSELFSDPGYNALLETASSKLSKSGKGEGKGKKGEAAERL